MDDEDDDGGITITKNLMVVMMINILQDKWIYCKTKMFPF